jgi:hypothetical protein
MKHITTLSTVALLLAAGALAGGFSKSEQSASTGTGAEVAVQQPAEQAPVTSDQAATDQSAASDQAATDSAPAGTAPGTVAGESE